MRELNAEILIRNVTDIVSNNMNKWCGSIGRME
jgi:hypothetical protein